MEQSNNDPSNSLDGTAPVAPGYTPAPEQAPEKTLPLGSLAPHSAQAPDMLKNIAAARSNGVGWDEINSALTEQRAQAKANGITDKEFNDALGLPQPSGEQQYFTMKEIANSSAKAFIDYPQAAWGALKADWQRYDSDFKHIPDSFWDEVKTDWDKQIAVGKIPIDVFNLAVSPLAAVYGAVVARPLSAAEANLTAMVNNALSDKITDPDTLKAWQQQAEGDINTALLALGPEGGELQLAARAKLSPMIQTKDTLDAAAAVAGDPAKTEGSLATIADNLHNNWVKTGEEPIAAAKRALTEPDFRDALHQPAIEPPSMSVLPETKEPIDNPKPVEEGEKINPNFANEKPVSPTLVEPPSPQLGAKVAGTAAMEPLTGVSDFKDLFIEDPIKAGGVAAEYIRNTFVPVLAGPEAREAALISRGNIGEMNRATAITQAALNSVWRKAGSIIGEDADKFIDTIQNFSKGVEVDPALQGPVDTLRGLFEDVRTQLSKLPSFAQMEFQKDYFPQNWKPNPANQARWDAMISRQGSTGFTKAKIIPSHIEGLELGFEPRYNHPLETAMNNLRNAYRLIANSKSIDEMIGAGLAERFTAEPKGAINVSRVLEEMKKNSEGTATTFDASKEKEVQSIDQLPKGWVRFEGGLAGDHGIGAVYGPPNVARIYNNSISKSFTGTPGEVFKVINASSNVLRQLKLGLLNVYHGVSTLISSIARESGLGVGEYFNMGPAIANGDILAAAKNLVGGTARILTAPMAPITHFMKGMKGLKEYKVPGSTDPQTQTLIDLLTKSNSVTAKIPDYMQEGAYKDMWDAWKAGEYDHLPTRAADFVSSLTYKNFPIKIPVAIAQQFSSFMSTTMKPIFDGLVPRIKTGAAMEALQQWMEDHPNATFEQQKAASAQIGDSTDNLFGEMIRDNNFQHKQFEQAINLGFLSYGWVMGEVRGVIAGAKDITTLNNTSNAQNLIGFVMTMAFINSTYQYLKTGQAPASIEDMAFPKTGGEQKAGGEQVPERAVLPGHTSQLAHYAHDPIGELFGNETNPLFGVIHLMTTGKNWAGVDAYNRNGDFAEKTEEFSKAIAKEIGPLTLENMMQPGKSGSNLNDVERFMGVRQAPQFVANPEGVKKQTEARQRRAWGESQRFQKRMDQSYKKPEKD